MTPREEKPKKLKKENESCGSDTDSEREWQRRAGNDERKLNSVGNQTEWKTGRQPCPGSCN